MIHDLADIIIIGIAAGWALKVLFGGLIEILYHQQFCRWLALLLVAGGFGYMPFSDDSLVPLGLIGGGGLLAWLVAPPEEQH
jgi:hypothetical protein